MASEVLGRLSAIEAQRSHAEAAAKGEPAAKEDILFHLAIARICGPSTTVS